jgi:sugar lactone lactonase YvrE
MRSRILLVLAFAVVAPLAARAQNISTVAGGGPINLPTLGASIGSPSAVRQDSAGNTYILDNPHNRVYKVDTSGNMTVFAGNGALGASGDNGPAVDAEMNGPSGMCIDTANNLYIADSDNNKIREVAATTANGHTIGDIYTFAGAGGLPDYNGDGGLAIDAFLHFPDGCALDSKGNLYIADRGNNEVRVVIGASNTPPVGVTGTTTGHIYNFAGDAAAVPPAPNPPAGYSANGTVATSAMLDGPFDVFVDSHDNVYIADLGNNFPLPEDPSLPQNNNVIREVPATTTVSPAMTAGSIYTIVGTPGSYGHSANGTLATSALLNQAIGLSVDIHGNLFFADSGNQVIREVPATTAGGMTAGDVYDVAGTAGSKSYSGDGGPATSASLSSPVGTLVDASDNIFISDSGSEAIREVTSADGNINTVNGNGHLSYGGDGLPATHGELNVPAGIAVDPSGNLIIADAGTPILTNSLIRGVPAPIASGNLSTITGQPEFNGFFGDGIPATGATIKNNAVVNNAIAVFTDPSSNIFIADTDNCVIREILASNGNIVTVAGTDPTVPDPSEPLITTPVCGFAGATGPATSATLGFVNGVAVDGAGDIFFSDSTNNIIWEVAKNTSGGRLAGHIYVAVGTPGPAGYSGDHGPAAAAQLNSPTGISFDVFGNLFIADTKNNVIREVAADNTTNPSPMTAGSIYTVAGNQSLGAGFSGDGAAATGAQLNNPFTMVVDHADNIFIADTNNDVIREVTSADGKINTVAGTGGTADFAGDGGPATAALLDGPEGLALDGAGDLLLADSVNNRVRSIAGIANLAAVPVASFDKTSLTFAIQLLNTPSAAQVVTLTNTGSAALSIASIALTGTNSGDFSLAPATTCGASLAASANCTISVKFTPTVNGPRTASVTITDGAASSPQTIALNGTGGLPTADLTGAPLTFASQVVGTPSAAQNVTLTNNGTIALAITGITSTGADSGDFALSPASTCGASLAISAHCTISVKFTPTAVGTRTAAVSIADDLVGSPTTFNLTGTGVAPGVGLNPASLTFATPQLLNTPSTPMSVKLTNTGTSVLTITGITITGANGGDFSLAPAGTCGASLAVSANCTINVTFTPTANGTRTASISIADSASGSPQTVALTGTGGSPTASFNTTTLTFSNQVVSTPSAAQSVTLTNNGAVPLSITGIAVSGTNSGDFTLAPASTCGASVAAGANCTISVTFTPGAVGARTAAVNVTDNAAASPQAITLNGTGVSATPTVSLSSSTLTFADQFVGTASAVQKVTVTNNSTSAVAVTGITVAGANAADYGQTNTCGTSLAGNANCTISVTFTPSATGARAGTVSIADSAAGSPQAVSLTGNGFDVSLTAASGGSLSQTVKAGQTATWALQLNPTGGAPTDKVTVNVACSGAPSLTTLNCPSSEAVPGTFNITAVTTGSAMLAPLSESEPKMQPPAAIRTLPLTLLAVLLFIAATLAWMQSPAGRMRTVRVALMACLVLMPVSATMFLTGCASSGGGSSTPPPPAATPAGTYTITVTMTVGSAKPQTSQLTLIVQ